MTSPLPTTTTPEQFISIIDSTQQSLEHEIKRAKTLLLQTSSTSSSNTNKIPFEWIEQLARRLSYTTHAPPDWHFTQNRPLPPVFAPPCPQPDAIKKGVLFILPEIQIQAIIDKEVAGGATTTTINSNKDDDSLKLNGNAPATTITPTEEIEFEDDD